MCKQIKSAAIALMLMAGSALAQTTVTTTSGTTNAVPKFSGASTIVDSAITEAAGKVGIGTTSPQFLLDVNGAARFNGVVNGLAFLPFTANTHLTLSATGTGNTYIGNGGTGSIQIGNNTGVIGLFGITTMATGSGVAVTNASATFGVNSYTSGDSYTRYMVDGGSRAVVGWSRSLQSLFIGPEFQTPWMTMNATKTTLTGSFGIGTTTPAFPLDVNGAIRASGMIYGLGIVPGVSDTNFSASATGSGTTYIGGAGTGYVQIGNDTAGVGLKGPVGMSSGVAINGTGGSILTMNSYTSGDTYIRYMSDSQTKVAMGWSRALQTQFIGPEGGTPWMAVNSSKITMANNVGIGNTAPQYPLDVTGNIRATGTVYAMNFSPSATNSSATFGGTGTAATNIGTQGTGRVYVGNSTGGVGAFGSFDLSATGHSILSINSNTSGIPAVSFRQDGQEKGLVGWNRESNYVFLTSTDGATVLTGNANLVAIGGGSSLVQVSAPLYAYANVGIKNNNPQYPLDVTGDVRATGTVYAANFSPTAANTNTSLSSTGTGITSVGGQGTGETRIGNAAGPVKVLSGLLDVNGIVRASGNTNPTTVDQGAYLGWNARTGGTGETDFINNPGSGPGGFSFMHVPQSGSPRTELMFINPNGTVDFTGSLQMKLNSGANIRFPDGTVQNTAWTPTTTGTMNIGDRLNLGNFGSVSAFRGAANNFTNLFLGGSIVDAGDGTYTVKTDGGSNYFGAIRMDNTGGNVGAINFYTAPAISGSQYTLTNDQLATRLRMTIQGSNVGIGTASPGERLEVAGNIKITGLGAHLIFPGGVQTEPWNGTTCGGDYAEAVDVLGERNSYEPGDVLAIDKKSPSNFRKATEPYSRRVAGIYSTKPGLLGRRQEADPTLTATAVPMALVGIVPTKVSAENGAIEPGDLLVSSSRAGYAMKGTDSSKMMGAVIGKAMGTLDNGTGVIEVLVSLQ